jgi:phosphoribosylformimino-5-aminoimidazole carboxamide ribotide isomerase
MAHGSLLWLLQEDLERVRMAGKGRVDITVGSALDIFGGKLPYTDVVAWHKQQQQQQQQQQGSA